jgi:ureidoglycolate lyase
MANLVTADRVTAQALTAQAFSPFGQVIELPERSGLLINQGTAERFNDVVDLRLTADAGRPQLSLFRVSPSRLPVRVELLERHPLSSQAFLPFDGRRFLVVVAPAASDAPVSAVRAFLTNGSQGVNYAPGVWHAPVIAVGAETHFAVIGRAGPETNCDTVRLAPAVVISIEAGGSD